MADSIIKEHRLDIVVGGKLDEKQMSKIKKNITKFAAEWQDEVENAKIGAALDSSLEDALKQVNKQLSQYELAPISIDQIKGFTEPFAKLGELAMQKFADGFGGGGGSVINSVTKEIGKIYDKLDKQTTQSTESVIKNVSHIEDAVKRMNKTRWKNLEKTLTHSPKVPKDQSSSVERLKSYYNAGVDKDASWESKYAADVNFVDFFSKFQLKLDKKGLNIDDVLGDELSKLFKDRFIQLRESYVDKSNMLQNVMALRDPQNPKPFVGYDTGEPWAREDTLQEIKGILQGKGGYITPTSDSKPKKDNNDINPKKQKKIKISEYDAYRAIENNPERSKEDALHHWGAEYWASGSEEMAREVVESYVGNFWKDGHVIQGKIKPVNPLTFDADGLAWNEFDKIPGIKELFPSIKDYADDDGQKYINEMAKKAGFDSVIFENVRDSFDQDTDAQADNFSTTIAVLDSHIVELIGAYNAPENKVNFDERVGIPSYYTGVDKEDSQTKLSRLQQQQETYQKWYNDTIPKLEENNIDKKIIDNLKSQYTKNMSIIQQEIDKINVIDPSQTKTKKAKVEADVAVDKPITQKDITGGLDRIIVDVEPNIINPVTPKDVMGGEEKIKIPVEYDTLSQTDSASQEQEQNKLFLYRVGKTIFDKNKWRNLDAMGNAHESLDPENNFGGFGDGLFMSTARAANDIALSKGEDFFEIDASDYDLYINQTVSQAEKLREFLLSLQKYILSAGDFRGFDDEIKGITNESLFKEASLIFERFQMSKDEFSQWIKQQKDLVVEKGFDENAHWKNVDNNNPYDPWLVSHNFGTRFMKTMGYEGVLNDTGDDDFDGMSEGSVIYDPDFDKITQHLEKTKHIFKTVKEFNEFIASVTSSTGNINKLDNNLPSASDNIQKEKVSIDESSLKGVLESVIYKVNLGEDVKFSEPENTEVIQTLKSIETKVGEHIAQEKTLQEINSKIGNTQTSSKKNNNNESGTQITDKAVLKEKVSLETLETSIQEVIKAVNSKTAAFIQEGKTVGQVIGKEISGLIKLQSHINNINDTVLELVGNLKNIKTASKADINVKVENVNNGGNSSSRIDRDEWKQLEEQHKKLGQLRARFDDTVDPEIYTETLNLQDEIDLKYKSLKLTQEEIKALKERAMIAEKSEKRIIQDEKDKAAKAKEKADNAKRASDIKALGDQYEKLGKLQAQGEAGDAGKAEEARQLAEIVEQETERLKLNEAQNAEILKSLQLKQQEAKESKTLVLAAKQEQKDANKAFREEVKAAQKEKGVQKANSTINAANNTFINTIGNEGLSDDISEKASELREAINKLNNIKNDVNKKVDKSINNQIPLDQTELNQQIKKVQELKLELDRVNQIHDKYSGDNASIIPGNVDSFRGLDIDNYEKQLTTFAQASVTGRLRQTQFNAETKELTGTVRTGANTFTTYSFAIDEVSGELKKLQVNTKKTETFMQGISRKMREATQYVIGSLSIYDVWNKIRQGVQYVKEIDSALTELKKVTDETEESYDKFLDTASKTADKIGSTIKDVISSTADFARLGYSMQEAATMAESAQVLMNVSEFTDISRATDSLISSIQAFKYTAEESMDVVDILNTIGNNYAISTADLATSLTKSSGSLVAANGTLEEAVALTATANTIIQDADVVGTALKTVAMRLRGTSTKEMEEEGLDTDGVVTSGSKLRSKIKGYSGVDILTDTGAYKSTYQILSEIADVWEDMNDMDQAALLELLAGKRAGSVMSAILQNPETLKDAFESASEASGSALEENEKYLDSIQGKIDLFTNAVQTMWSNTLDSELVKGVVALGTELVKIVDEIGLINSLLIGFGIFATKKYNLFGNIFGTPKDINDMREEYEKLKLKATKATEVFDKNPNKRNQKRKDEAIRHRDGYYKINLAPQDEFENKKAAAEAKLKKAQDRLAAAQQKEANGRVYATSTMKTYESAVESAKKQLNNLNEETKEKIVLDNIDKETTEGKVATTFKELGVQIMKGQVTKANIKESLKNILITKLTNMGLTESIAKYWGVQASQIGTLTTTQLLTGGFMGLATAIWTALAPFLPFVAAAAALVGTIVLVAKGIDKAVVTVEEAKEQLSNLNSEINSLTSDLDSLNSQLETTQERMEELLSKDSLSFVEQEELNNLKLQNEQLEKQIELQKLLIENKKKSRTSAAKNVLKKTWDSKSYGKEDYQVTTEGIIEHDSFWGFGKSGKDAINDSIKQYNNTKSFRDTAYDTYATSLKKYGAEDFLTKINKKEYDVQEEKLKKQADGINMVLGEMADVIAENELQYGDDTEVNRYLDEYYAMSLKWQETQGISGKSDVIKHIFNDTSSKDIQNLKNQLEEVAGSDLEKAQKLIQDAIDSTDGDYQRLKATMGVLELSAEDLAKAFVAVSKAPDISTLGGVFEVFADGEEILRKYNDKQAELGKDENGDIITWGNLFEKKEDKMVADPLKVSAILEGADKEIRDQFTKLITEVENGKMSLNEALAKWEMTGIDKAIDVLNTEFESLNNEMFPEAAEEISGLIDSVNELKAAFESVASTMDLLHTAQEQFNNSGRISVKTALELMSSTDEWDKVLTITEDSIKLNKNAEQELIQTQLDSIATQTRRSAELAKTKYEAALAAQTARELADAEKNVAVTQNNANEVTNQRTNQMGNLASQTYNTAISELDYADNDDVVQTAESVKAKAVGLVSASIIGLDAAIQAFTSSSFGNRFSNAAKAWSSAYGEARNAVIADANGYTATVSQLKKDYENKRDIANVAANADKYGDFKNYYDYDKTPGDKYKDDSKSDKFQKEMDYWENRIAANQAKYEQIQNEIDLLEKQGKIVGEEYYKEQIKLENQRLKLLESQRAAAKKMLGTFKEGSDEWFKYKPAYKGNL